MLKHSPIESVHALDVAAMHAPELQFYSAWRGEEMLACGALKRHQDEYAELKSMKTRPQFVRQGVGQAMLDFLISEAVHAGYQTLYLETGSMQAFVPARALYRKAGFIQCEPFADYTDDPHSVCMKLSLAAFAGN